MPELPEVQTVANNLSTHLPGKIIQSIDSPNNYTKVVEGGAFNCLNQNLTNNQINQIGRRGKFIILHLSNGYLLIHLRMTGRLITELTSEMDMKYVSFRLVFKDGTKLFFRDIRKFGRIYFSDNLDWLENKLGIEPLSKEFTPQWLNTQLKQKKRMMKSLLLDQSFIAGLGNIYVDEALWFAGINPMSISSQIRQNKVEALCRGIKQILQDAIHLNGTTFQSFSFGKNSLGSYIEKLKIFGKPGLPCPICSTSIQKIKIGQRGTHFCPKCQAI